MMHKRPNGTHFDGTAQCTHSRVIKRLKVENLRDCVTQARSVRPDGERLQSQQRRLGHPDISDVDREPSHQDDPNLGLIIKCVRIALDYTARSVFAPRQDVRIDSLATARAARANGSSRGASLKCRAE